MEFEKPKMQGATPQAKQTEPGRASSQPKIAEPQRAELRRATPVNQKLTDLLKAKKEGVPDAAHDPETRQEEKKTSISMSPKHLLSVLLPTPKAKIVAVVATLLMASVFMVGGNNGDNLSNDQINQVRQNYEQQVAAGQVNFPALNLADPAAVASAMKGIDAMPIPQQQREQIKAQIEQQKASPNHSTEFLVLKLYDFCQVDGDTVVLTAPGFGPATYRLDKTDQIAIIPHTIGTPLAIQIHGIADGGGGETLGIKTTNGPLSVPVFQLGDTLTITVK